eukprot:6206266-Pleurochrysis_carterae.AAC.5
MRRSMTERTNTSLAERLPRLTDHAMRLELAVPFSRRRLPEQVHQQTFSVKLRYAAPHERAACSITSHAHSFEPTHTHERFRGR